MVLLDQTRVLIGIPTYPGHAYCREEFVANTRKLIHASSARTDALVAWNGDRRASGFPQQWKRWTYAPQLGDRGVDVLRAKQQYIRDYALKHDYTHLFLLESDTLPPVDTLDRLLQAEKDIVSAIYFIRSEEAVHVSKHYLQAYFQRHPNILQKFPDLKDTGDVVMFYHRYQPSVWGLVDGRSTMWKMNDAFPQRGLVQVLAAGLGASLIHRDVLEAVPEFRLRDEQADVQQFTDFLFYHDAHNAGFEAYVDTDIIAEHLHDYDVDDEGTVTKWFDAETLERKHKPRQGYKADADLTTHQRSY
jgi:hypothetical protein